MYPQHHLHTFIPCTLEWQQNIESIHFLFQPKFTCNKGTSSMGNSAPRSPLATDVLVGVFGDAFQAFKRYNDVLEIIGANPVAVVSALVNVVGGADGKRKTVVMVPKSRVPRRGFVASNRFAILRGCRGGTISGRRVGSGRGRLGGIHWKKKSEKSAEELDKELDNYHADAMQSQFHQTVAVIDL